MTFFFAIYWTFLLLYRECYGFEKKRFFFSLRRSPRYTPSPYLAKPTLLLSRLPWKQAVLPWKLQGLVLRFKTQNGSINFYYYYYYYYYYYFESHSVQRQVLVGRFSLSGKALRNTISSTTSKFWAYYLKAICIAKRMSYQLGHRSSWWYNVYKPIYLLLINYKVTI